MAHQIIKNLGAIAFASFTERSENVAFFATFARAECQGFGGLAADVERFRQSLRVPRILPERAVTAITRGAVERPPVELGFAR
jgi:hypothetical protein